MKQPRHLLVEAIAERTLHVHDYDKLAAEIAGYLLIENRVSELDSILRDIIEYRAQHGVVEVTTVSAHSLSDAVKQDVKSIVKQDYPRASSVTISERIDPEVVGGLRIDLPHEQLDLTLRSQLANFKRLTGNGKG